MIRYYTSAVSLLVTAFAFGQTQHSAYTAVGKGVATTFLTDYQSLGVNNSALGWGTGYDDKTTTMGTSEFGFGITSPALDKERVDNAFKGIQNTIFDRDNESFDLDAQREAAAEYAEAGIAIDADYNWFGLSYQSEDFGGIAVAIRERYSWFSQLNEQTSDLVFRGKLSNYFDSLDIYMDGEISTIANSPDLSEDTLNAVIRGRSNDPSRLSEITDGSGIRMSWNREFNIGYGRRIVGEDSTFALYGGVGGRFIRSIAMFDFSSSDGELSLNSAISPFYEIDYGDVALDNPSSLLEKDGLLPQVTGNGYGVDLSLSAIIFKKLKLAAAVNNFGSITYDKNVYSVRDTSIQELSVSGLDDYDVTESMSQLLQNGGLFNLVGEESHTVSNPANIRFGGSIELGRMFNVGVDVIAPFSSDTPGSLENPVVSIGGDFKPTKWLHLSTGYFGGGIYSHNIPVGVNFVLSEGTYEFGIASRDALAFFIDDTNSVSAALGFARIRF